jgi:hypothetical protein
MPKSNVRTLSRAKQKQNAALDATDRREDARSLRTGQIEAGTAIDFQPFPAALWSLDRRLL